MYSVSIVNYYNTSPFLYGIANSLIKNSLNIELDIPSVCAQKFKNKQVDIGLVPVAILPELTNYNIITDYCIGANGKVDSVKLYANKPLNELTHIMLDYQSKTSVTLIQVLNKHFWKKNIEFINTSEGFENKINNTTGAVIIGDRTFGLNNFPYEYDLSDEWKKYTGLPFVFACWVSNKPLPANFVTDFNLALQLGVKNIETVVKQNPSIIKGFDAFDYLQNKISYTFDEDKKTALNKFLSLINTI